MNLIPHYLKDADGIVKVWFCCESLEYDLGDQIVKGFIGNEQVFEATIELNETIERADTHEIICRGEI